MHLKRKPLIAATTVLLIVLPLWAYWSLWNADYINFDDHQYIVINPLVTRGLSLQGIAYALTAFTQSNWHPVTWLAHMVDFDLFGQVPGAHHLSNVVVHCLASVALFATLTRLPLTRKQAAFAALVFALHPLQVESVAWASQRKATLSALFGFLTLFAWLDAGRNGSHRTYGLAVFFFALSLMSKSAFMTLPAVMVLIDLLLIQRQDLQPVEGRQPVRWTAWIFRDKIPFWLLALGSGVMTLVSGMTANAKALALNDTMPLSWRVLNAFRAYVAYCRDFLIPRDFSIFYPMNKDTPETALSMICLGILVAVTLIVFRFRRTRPFLLFGWLWFLGVLLPMSGVIQTGYHARANRFMYLPIVGLALMVGAGIQWSWLKKALTPIAVVLVLLMAWGTAHQVRYWQNDGTLFAYSTKTIPLSRFNYMLALYHLKHGRKDLGLEELERFYPKMLTSSEFIIPAAESMSQYGAREEARALMARASEDAPEMPQVWTARARLLDVTEDKDTRLEYLLHALALDPNFGPANYLIGRQYMLEGRYSDALRPMVLARNATDPSPDPCYQLGVIYEHLGNAAMATKMFEEQLALTPGHLPTLHALGALAVNRGDNEGTVKYFGKVFKHKPELLAQPHLLAFSYGKLGRFEEAVEVLQFGLKRNPDDMESRLLLGKALELLKDTKGAKDAYRQVLAQDPESKDALQGLSRLGVAP